MVELREIQLPDFLIALLVLLVYHDTRAFWLDMALSCVLIVLGLAMGLWPGRGLGDR